MIVCARFEQGNIVMAAEINQRSNQVRKVEFGLWNGEVEMNL